MAPPPRRQSITGHARLHTQRNGSKTMLITLVDTNSAYLWSKYGNPTSIYDKNQKEGNQKQPLAYIVFNIDGNYFECDEPQNIHVCSGPLSMNKVRGVEVARCELSKLKETRDKPSKAAVKVSNSITRRYANFSEEDRHYYFYFVPQWVNNSLGRSFFTVSDLDKNRTNNYGESFHGKQSLYYTKKHPKLGCFMYDDRLLQDHMEQDIKLKEADRRLRPTRETLGDERISEKRGKLIANLQRIYNPSDRSKQFVFRLYQLGKAAGMGGRL